MSMEYSKPHFLGMELSGRGELASAVPLLAFLYDKGHWLLEAALVLTIVVMLLQHQYRPQKRTPLTEEETDALCREWSPEPLVPALTPAMRAHRAPVLTTGPGPHAVADGRRVVNLAATDFLGAASVPAVRAAAESALRKYGCGSCGPRGFYGTIDAHLSLERALAQFMGTDAAIIYSYDVATIASAIPAFAKKGDLVVADDGCGYAVQAGLGLSRADVRTFKHNDVADLERVLKAHATEAAAARSPLTRRFLVVEGLYANTGDVPPLPALVALKEKYRLRLIVEESLSFGVLGKTGRGLSEHWGLPVTVEDLVTASMGNALGAVGGFCVGSRKVVDHQRLSGSGYVFSASLPPFLAAAAQAGLDHLGASAPLLAKLAATARSARRALASCPHLLVEGDAVSPVIHARLRAPRATADAEAALERIAARLLLGGVLVAVARYSQQERRRPPPSLRLTLCAQHDEAEVVRACEAVGAAAAAELGSDFVN